MTNYYLYDINDYQLFVEKYNKGEFDLQSKLIVHLMSNIDFTDVEFKPFNHFKHVFKGHGFKLINVLLSERVSESLGIFNILEGTVENLIVNGEISGKINVGGIAGILLGGTIKNCINEATVTTVTFSDVNFKVGGIAGVVYNQPGTEAIIKNCINKGTIKTYQDCGGIVGSLEYGTIDNCCNRGKVSAQINSVGGIAGHIKALSLVNQCYNTGTITCLSELKTSGGIIGICDSDCGANRVSSCFYLKDSATSGFGNIDPSIPDTKGHVLCKTYEAMQVKSTFTGWDFDEVWVFEITLPRQTVGFNVFPSLRYEVFIDAKDYPDDSWFDKDVENQYIHTPDQFAALSYIIESAPKENIEYKFFQTKDLDFKNKIISKQIGTEEIPFQYVYNGKNNKFRNLNNFEVRRGCVACNDFNAIFGYNTGTIANMRLLNITSYAKNNASTSLVCVNDGLVSDIIVKNSKLVSELSYIAGLVGINKDNGMIANCAVCETTISNKYDYKGQEIPKELISMHGVAGICCLNYGYIYLCMNLSNIDVNSNDVGGIVSRNFGIVGECNDSCRCDKLMQDEYIKEIVFNQYEIKGLDNVGGVIGQNYNNVILCSNRNIITGNNNIGGITGITQNDIKNSSLVAISSIILSYNNGPVISLGEYAGGITGKQLSGVIDSCYSASNGALTGVECNSYAGGIAGYLKGSLIKSYSSFYMTGSTKPYVGTLIGFLDNEFISDGTFVNNYGCIDINNNTKTIGGNSFLTQSYDTDNCISLNYVDMCKKESYLDYNFDDIWFIKKDNTPKLRMETITRNYDNIISKSDLVKSIGIKSNRFHTIYAKQLKGSIDMSDLKTNDDDFVIINGNEQISY